MFKGKTWKREDAVKAGNYLTVDKLGELPEWTPVVITGADDSKKKANGREYAVVTFKTKECQRLVNMSYFHEGHFVELFDALKIVELEELAAIVGMECQVKFAADENPNTGRRYIVIDAYRPAGVAVIKNSTGQGEELELPNRKQDIEDVPF